MTKLTTLKTAELPQADRAGTWCDWLSQHFDGLHTQPNESVDFGGAIESCAAGPMAMARLTADSHRVVRDAGGLRRSQFACLKIIAPWHGTAFIEQAGRCTAVAPGEWAIYDTGREYGVINPEHVDHLIVMLPAERFADRSLRMSEVLVRPVSATAGIGRLALEAMRTTFAELPCLSSASAQGASDFVHHLVLLALLDLVGRETATTQLASLRSRAEAYIQRHMRDSGLTVTSIAEALNCSRRHLYNAFSDDPDTVGGYILRERMQACIRDMQARENTQKTITDIAMSWGFSSMSHFSRVFRECTQMTPSVYRTSIRRSQVDNSDA